IAGIANIPYVNSTLGVDVVKRHFNGEGEKSRAFILDVNNKNRGIIYNQYYYSKSLQGKVNSMSWADFNEQPGASVPDTEWYERWSEYYFETARYLLLNNKKQTGSD